MAKWIFAFIVIAANIFSVPAWGQAGKVSGMYHAQMQNPASQLNIGLTYWIELKRGDIRTRVSNKTEFQQGDKIRFHVRPNIDGYAYILMEEGSNGDRSVIFPAAQAGENKVTSGTEIAIPTAAEGQEGLVTI
jgi:hypothetical protein